MFHIDWVLEKLNVGKTYLYFVMQAKSDEDVGAFLTMSGGVC